MKCDLCNKPAVVHEVTVQNGVKQELHYCEDHAREHGFAMPGHQPIEAILKQFVVTSDASPKIVTGVSCESCGLTLNEFRKKGVLGCPACYPSMGRSLAAIIERAQNGGTNHVGKSPRRVGACIDRQLLIGRLVKDLEDAVSAEQFERAARLRDQLRELESQEATTAEDAAGVDRSSAAGDQEPPSAASHGGAS